MKVLDQVETEEQICKFGEDICKALVHCHSLNIIHRDLKPQNIFLSRDGNFKLGDFGIAKFADQVNRGTRIGTVSYMAPEVYTDLPYGHGADIYSLGVTLYWLLNEKRLPLVALPPAAPTTMDVQNACLARLHGHALPPPARASQEMSRIVLKACAYNPAERYASAQEMLWDLQALRAGRRSAPAAPGGYPANQTWKAGETAVLSPEDYRQLMGTGRQQGGQTPARNPQQPAAPVQQQAWSPPVQNPQPAAPVQQQSWQQRAQAQQRPIVIPPPQNTGKKKSRISVAAVFLGLLLVLGGLYYLFNQGVFQKPEATAAGTSAAQPAPTEAEATRKNGGKTTRPPEESGTEPATTEAPAAVSWEPGIHSYEFVQSDCDWDTAWEIALEMGGHLACFETEEEFLYVLQLHDKAAPDLGYLRIGAKRDDGQEAYYWRDGNCEPYGPRLDSKEAECYGKWGPGEPTLEWKGEEETRCVLRYSWDRRVWELNDAGNAVSSSLDPERVGYIIEYETKKDN